VHGLAAPGEIPTVSGKTGEWRIEIDILECRGPLGLAAQRA